MKLSVIVPVYKVEQYLEQCIESMLSQDLDDYEVILINDGSPDKSGEIMDRYREKYPHIIKTITVENGGQGRARNIGLSVAQGEYIGFVDSDDYVACDMFSKMLQVAEKEQADIVVCDSKKVFYDGTTEYFSVWEDKEILRAAGACWDKIFRKDIIKNIRFSEGLWYEDLCFSAKLLMRAKKIVHLNEALYLYRCGQISTMNNQNSLKNLDIISVMDDIRNFVEENGIEKQGFEFLLINHVLLDSINRVSRQNSDDRDEVIAKLRTYVKTHIPNLFGCSSFKGESRNRRVIMILNYFGFHNLSKFLLSVKSK